MKCVANCNVLLTDRLNTQDKKKEELEEAMRLEHQKALTQQIQGHEARFFWSI